MMSRLNDKVGWSLYVYQITPSRGIVYRLLIQALTNMGFSKRWRMACLDIGIHGRYLARVTTVTEFARELRGTDGERMAGVCLARCSGSKAG